MFYSIVIDIKILKYILINLLFSNYSLEVAVFWNLAVKLTPKMRLKKCIVTITKDETLLSKRILMQKEINSDASWVNQEVNIKFVLKLVKSQGLME